MNAENSLSQYSISLLEEHAQLTLVDLCCARTARAEQITALADIGILEPQGREPAPRRI